jgi:hypothetical protein
VDSADEAPRDDTERAIAGVWEALFGRERVGIRGGLLRSRRAFVAGHPGGGADRVLPRRGGCRCGGCSSIPPWNRWRRRCGRRPGRGLMMRSGRCRREGRRRCRTSRSGFGFSTMRWRTWPPTMCRWRFGCEVRSTRGGWSGRWRLWSRDIRSCGPASSKGSAARARSCTTGFGWPSGWRTFRRVPGRAGRRSCGGCGWRRRGVRSTWGSRR